MQIINIASYKFIALSALTELHDNLKYQCKVFALKGTILLSKEGINLSLAGEKTAISDFKSFLKEDVRFADMSFRESLSSYIPYKRLKIKIKDETITMRCPEIRPEIKRAQTLTPEKFKKLLQAPTQITLLDTRNEYEVRYGTFDHAISLNLKDFSEFPQAAKNLPREKPIIMFCTGGIRCEKAALHLLNVGFEEVYQLEGGILNYFHQVGGEHFQGNCFVFDQRIALNAHLQELTPSQRLLCQLPIDSQKGEGSLTHCPQGEQKNK